MTKLVHWKPESWKTAQPEQEKGEEIAGVGSRVYWHAVWEIVV
jgi:hypothetical protein